MIGDTKFAECDCTFSDEDWIKTDEHIAVEHDDGDEVPVEVSEYICQTCETICELRVPLDLE